MIYEQQPVSLFSPAAIQQIGLLYREMKAKQDREEELDSLTYTTAQQKLKALTETEGLSVIDQEGRRIPLLKLNYDKQSNLLELVPNEDEPVAASFIKKYGNPLQRLSSYEQANNLTQAGFGTTETTKRKLISREDIEKGKALRDYVTKPTEEKKPGGIGITENLDKLKKHGFLAIETENIKDTQIPVESETEAKRYLSYRDEIQRDINQLNRLSQIYDIYNTPMLVRGVQTENPYRTLLALRSQELQRYDQIRNETLMKTDQGITSPLIIPGTDKSYNIIQTIPRGGGGGGGGGKAATEADEKPDNVWKKNFTGKVKTIEYVMPNGTRAQVDIQDVNWIENKNRGYSLQLTQDKNGQWYYKVVRQFERVYNKDTKTYEWKEMTIDVDGFNLDI